MRIVFHHAIHTHYIPPKKLDRLYEGIHFSPIHSEPIQIERINIFIEFSRKKSLQQDNGHLFHEQNQYVLSKFASS